MDYSFECSVREGYLHLRIEGLKDERVIRRYVQDMLKAAAEEKCPNVLIEEHLRGDRFSTTRIFQVVGEHLEAVRSKLRLIAFVDASPQPSASNSQFAENVAVNRGLNVRTFASVEEAEHWLRARIDLKGNPDPGEPPPA